MAAVRPFHFQATNERPKMTSFEHKSLGYFKQLDWYGQNCWQAEIEIAAFSAFKYCRNGRTRRSKKVHVSIYCDGEPPKVATQMLLKIRKSQKKLVNNICQTFFDDLHQNGYHAESVAHSKFGMWWSEDPVEVAMSCREALLKRVKRDRLEQPDDLFAVLYEPSIAIYPSMMVGNSIPRTLINMGAEFEDEHGVSVLTDGSTVLNLGYSGEA